MPDQDIGPRAGLVSTAPGGTNTFALFTDDWLQLQSFVGAAVNLPITQGNFEEKYGSFGGQAKITECIQAMRQVQGAAKEFGDPKSLRASLIQNPNLLATPKPPAEIYTHTVWLGQKIHTTASTLSSGYASVLDGLQDLPNAEKVANLKEFLFDATIGPIPLAASVNREIGDLIKKLGAFEAKMNEFNKQLQVFTRTGSVLLKEVDVKIGALGPKIERLERLRDEAWEEWKKFTIAASVSAGACLLIGGILSIAFMNPAPLAIGAGIGLAVGGGLGIKAGLVKQEYNEYCEELQNANQDLVKSQLLKADLGGFNVQVGKVAPAMQSFLKNLQKVQGTWAVMAADLQQLSNSVTESNVGNVAFLVKAKADKAIKDWDDVDLAAKQFTVDSLVDMEVGTFGEKLPEKQAA